MPRPKKRQATKVLGVIDPYRLYTADACLRHCGIGRASLAEARQSKIVTPLFAAGRAYYRGVELIEWIETCGKRMAVGQRVGEYGETGVN